jgi:ribonuclease HII
MAVGRSLRQIHISRFDDDESIAVFVSPCGVAPRGTIRTVNGQFPLDQDLRTRGYRAVAGVDESGRSSWAGPMVAAAVILPESFNTTAIRDSKLYKTEAQRRRRKEQCERIRSEAVVSVAHVSAAEIDEASNAGAYDACHIELFRRTVGGLALRPDFVVFDYYKVSDLGIDSEAPSRAERLSAAVAAASIVAKVTLDQMMIEYDTEFPSWGFAQNLGMRGTDGMHAAALSAHGPSPIHRLSSKGVKRALGGWVGSSGVS